MTQDNIPEASEPTTGHAGPEAESPAPAKKAAARKAPAKKTPAKKTPAKKATATTAAAKKTAAKKAPAKKSVTKKVAEAVAGADTPESGAPDAATPPAPRKRTRKAPEQQPAKTGGEGDATPAGDDAGAPGTAVLFKAPDESQAPQKPAPGSGEDRSGDTPTEGSDKGSDKGDGPDTGDDSEGGDGSGRRRRRRGGRRRRKSGGGGGGGEGGPGAEDTDQAQDEDEQSSGTDEPGESGSTSSRRRRRRRRAGEDGPGSQDDPQNTVTKVRKTRSAEDQITAVTGSTRLEAKKQRRREGREAGRRRAPIVSEAEFLARRESVDRVMAIRQRDDLTQIGVLEDKVLVEHYVARESQTSLIGNVFLGRVQNVLPSMEAAFIDIGKGRNAVLYAGEVNWSALGHKEGQPRKIESVLSSGQSVLVQVTKDPVGHKGARLTSQISLAGRFLVYVPDGTNSGISRKLPDTERNRLKSLLKEIVPDGAGVIVRTAAEGASEEELTRDVERLRARWEDIEKGAKKASGGAQLLYGEPDLMLKVVRDLFTEDFSKLVVQGDDAWDTVHGYVDHVAPDLGERLERYDDGNADLFAAYRIDEQIHKGLDRKVWLPSGGSLIIDRTEAMTVVDVNTGKFTGSGGNLEETVTKNNLEAAEEIVRQLRLRDIGGIIVVDFIDMVLESNRDLVLRRLVECLGRDRTRHQVAEVTSLGLVQMTRKRIGTGLLEAFSETCDHCNGRGLLVADAPVEPKRSEEDSRRSSRRSRRGRGGNGGDSSGGAGKSGNGQVKSGPSPKDVAAMSRPPSDADNDGDAAEQPGKHEQSDQAGKKTDQPKQSGTADKGGKAQKPERPDEPNRPDAAGTAEGAEQSEQAQESVRDEPADRAEHTEQAAPEPPADPTPPKVVTRTRRRSASRPAGPPAGTTPALSESQPGVGSIGSPPVDGNVEPGTADAEPAAPPTVEHVPVKKRGSRKR